jgi:hypothetical protein
MAKKQKTEVEPTPQVVEQPKVETPVMEKPKPVKIRKADLGGKKIDDWEIKNRTYILRSDKKPLTYTIRNQGLTWFDEEKGYAREILATENQKTVFVDEMLGDYRPMHIIFENGALYVPKEKVMLQKVLSLYHPYLNKLYEEVKPVAKAASTLEVMDMEIDALIVARDMDIELAEAIMRVEIGSKVSNMTSKELKRDLLIFAKNNPRTFITLANDDNVQLRNKGIKAVEMGLITLSPDQRTFTWVSNGRKLINVPFDEHPYNALAAWFKTDEGMEVYSSIEKRLK